MTLFKVGVTVVAITLFLCSGALFYTFYIVLSFGGGDHTNDQIGSKIEGFDQACKSGKKTNGRMGKSRKLKGGGGKLRRSLLGKSRKMSSGKSTVKSKFLGRKTPHTGKFSRLSRATCKIISHTTSDSERLAKARKLQMLMQLKMKSSAVQQTQPSSLLRQSSSSKIQPPSSSEALEGQGGQKNINSDQKVKVKGMATSTTRKPSSSSTSTFAVTYSKKSSKKCSSFCQKPQPMGQQKLKSTAKEAFKRTSQRTPKK